MHSHSPSPSIQCTAVLAGYTPAQQRMVEDAARKRGEGTPSSLGELETKWLAGQPRAEEAVATIPEVRIPHAPPGGSWGAHPNGPPSKACCAPHPAGGEAQQCNANHDGLCWGNGVDEVCVLRVPVDEGGLSEGIPRQATGRAWCMGAHNVVAYVERGGQSISKRVGGGGIDCAASSVSAQRALQKVSLCL